MTIDNPNTANPFIRNAGNIILHGATDGTYPRITSVAVRQESTILFTFPTINLDENGCFVFWTREVMDGLILPEVSDSDGYRHWCAWHAFRDGAPGEFPGGILFRLAEQRLLDDVCRRVQIWQVVCALPG